jgi:hypothetical protein
MRNIPQQSNEKKGFVIGAATSNQTIAKITVKKPTERKLSSSPAPSYIRLLPNNFKQKLFNFTPIETSLFRKLIDNKIVPLQNNTVNPRLLQQMRGFEEMTAKPKTSVQIKSLCSQLSLYMPKLDEFSVQKKTNRDEHLLSQNASESRRRLNMSPRVEKIVYRTNLNMGGRGSPDPPKFSLDCERLTPSKGYLFPKGQSNPSLASYRDELTHNYNFKLMNVKRSKNKSQNGGCFRSSPRIKHDYSYEYEPQTEAIN